MPTTATLTDTDDLTCETCDGVFSTDEASICEGSGVVTCETCEQADQAYWSSIPMGPMPRTVKGFEGGIAYTIKLRD